MSLSSISPTGARWPRILSEHLVPVAEPLAVALEPGGEALPRAVVAAAARALLDGTPVQPVTWPSWLAPHQVPAADRLTGIIARHGGAVLADEVGLGKSFIALAVALARQEPFALVVPAVLLPQWRGLLGRFGIHDTPIITHESLSIRPVSPVSPVPPVGFIVVDEAHRFRNPETNRYRALAQMVVGRQVLLVTATPIHNRIADLLHLLRLFLRDHALAGLGLPSLRAAAQRDDDTSLANAAVARLIVARSRARVQSGYNGGPVTLSFPRSSGETVRVGTTSDAVLIDLISGVSRLRAGGSAAPLLRLMLLRRLGSSVPAFRAALLRYDAYLDLATRATAEGRTLTAREFQRCFPRAAETDVQLILFPLLLEQPAGGEAKPPFGRDREIVTRLRATVSRLLVSDPKADALEQVLDARPCKTIVFTDAQPTVRYLMHRLRHRRIAAVFGQTGRFAAGDASRRQILQAFAPSAQGVAAPPAALATDVLIATDLLSEGLNLQDAERVIHYDLPWSPARLAQREGRIDRLGSSHSAISMITFLPPKPLAEALAIEERLAAKVSAQHVAGSNGRLDWCDQLAGLAAAGAVAARGLCAAVRGSHTSVVLIVRIARLVDAIVVEDGVARTNPSAATQLLAEAVTAPPAALDRSVLQQAIELAAPLIRARLAAIQDARWRAGDRDRFARRLIPWVLSAARRAARRGDGEQLRALDTLVSRLSLGMTAGEEFLLDDVLSQRQPLTVSDLLAWHMRLPVAECEETADGVELVAALASALA
ncbi:MAG TPA: DEAD/DEAH box helicase [Gemmatimonadales bacterium]|nr:DEAD/DEAH box helicase [Gemmatimonadales bacterium]